MITVFLGHRRQIGHLVYSNHQNGEDFLTDDAKEWCDKNLRGSVGVLYEKFKQYDAADGRLKEFYRYLFEFEHEDDVIKFKLFLVR